jgi:hypothetical protein
VALGRVVVTLLCNCGFLTLSSGMFASLIAVIVSLCHSSLHTYQASLLVQLIDAYIRYLIQIESDHHKTV